LGTELEVEMASSVVYRSLKGSEHPHPADHKKLRRTSGSEEVTVTLLLRRRAGHPVMQPEHMAAGAPRPGREAFASQRGADPKELESVAAFAKENGMKVLETDAARRSVIVRGPADAINKAFNVELNDYEYERGTYRSHDGAVKLPSTIADYVEAVVGLTNRQVHARHFSTARRHGNRALGKASNARSRGAAKDPVNTGPLTPAQVAALYGFPAGDGAGQTIGLYEMATPDPNTGQLVAAGYATADIAATMQALGDLPMPRIVDVPVDGVQNSGQSDGETGLDITVAGAIAPKATIAVYFAGGETQNIIHALQKMIHPNTGDPIPSIISISYGWGPDDPGNPNFSDSEYAQITGLFEDAATNKITVFVSSGDSGAQIESKTQAQTSYPASDVWVTACGGTTIGNVDGSSFDEYVWNDIGAAGPGATGGGVSARFPVPDYQTSVSVPPRIGTGQPGRGVPDIAGNASENSGYMQVINGSPPQPVGGTSAVAPLYAGLMALINANLGHPVGYLNSTLYTLPVTTFRDTLGAPGPANNSFGRVKGYNAGPGWDACTGLGSVHGEALQTALAGALPAVVAAAPAAKTPVAAD
jgi:kumamolisin